MTTERKYSDEAMRLARCLGADVYDAELLLQGEPDWYATREVTNTALNEALGEDAAAAILALTMEVRATGVAIAAALSGVSAFDLDQRVLNVAYDYGPEFGNVAGVDAAAGMPVRPLQGGPYPRRYSRWPRPQCPAASSTAGSLGPHRGASGRTEDKDN